jgi:hypothetical protein
MSQPFRLSSRAVAAGAFAAVLTAGSFAPALADNGKGGGGKGGKGGTEQSKKPESAKPESKPAAKPESGKPASKPAGKPADKPGGKSGTGDPAGNNGTFKVDGPAYDDGKGNEPHVACEFRLKFYGFDDGQTGDITISGQAPSGSGVVSEKTGVLISDDAAGGGNDLDAIVSYTMSDLDLSGLTAHPQQGYHLKVTLTTDAPGGVKHKVFWLEPCATTPDTGGTDTGGTDTDTGGTDTDTGGTDTGTGGTGGTGIVAPTTGTRPQTDVLGTKFEQAGTTGSTGTTVSGPATGAEVLGTKQTRGPGGLPFTGSPALLLLAIGSGLVAVGGTVVAAARRARHTA